MSSFPMTIRHIFQRGRSTTNHAENMSMYFLNCFKHKHRSRWWLYILCHLFFGAEKNHQLLEVHDFQPRNREGHWMSLEILYPLVICYIAIENGHLYSEFPMKNGGSFHSYVTNYQRVPIEWSIINICPFWTSFRLILNGCANMCESKKSFTIQSAILCNTLACGTQEQASWKITYFIQILSRVMAIEF